MTTKATPAAPTTQVPSQPTAPVITAPKSYAYAALYSSYQLKYESKSWVDMNTLRLKNNQNGFFAASYFDFDNDGDDDILVSPSGDAVELKRYNNDPSITKGDLELYTNQNGQYELSQTVFSPNGVGHIGPRKTILGDYDGDKMIDVLLLGTGYDPFPDEKEDPVLLINKGGKFNANSMTIMRGYRHGGCSGDIDKDGDIDVLLVGGNAQESNLFLNSGDGKFIANDNIFIDTMIKIGEKCKQSDIVFCIEPNSKLYSCNYITNSSEAFDILSKINHPNVKLHLDSACMHMESDFNIKNSDVNSLLNHYHISEPYLSNFFNPECNHNYYSKSLFDTNYQKVKSIEMKYDENNCLNNISNAIFFAKRAYF